MSNMKKENIILFDLDGTLIDSTNAIVDTFCYTFEKMRYKYSGDDEDIKNLIGYPLDIMFEKLGVPKKRAFDFVDVYKKRYTNISKDQTFLLDEVIETLELAKSFARLSIVTTKARNATEALLEHLKIMHYFEYITGRDDVQNPKPHPEPILKTLDLMDVEISSSNIFMIGDTKLDLIAAKESKISAIGVLCGYGKENELKLHTPYIAENALDAVKLIKNILLID